ncbi:MAG: type II secretion system protein [Bacilli bacterium]|nr:type II secretion system protein [Bacilli bacterium]
MKNNKGFTLIELLAVIVLLSVIIIVAGPNLVSEASRKKTEEQNSFQRKIENAAKLYAAKYYADTLSNSDVTVTADALEKDGLIELGSGTCTGDIVVSKTEDETKLDVTLPDKCNNN